MVAIDKPSGRGGPRRGRGRGFGWRGWGRRFDNRGGGYSGPQRGGVRKYRGFKNSSERLHFRRTHSYATHNFVHKKRVLSKEAVHVELATWNVTGEKSATPEEIDGILVKKRHPDIVCLQEVKSLPSEDFKGTENYKWFCAGPGSAVLISNKSGITGDNFEQLSPQICHVEATLKNGTKVKVISCFMPPSTEYAAEELWTKVTELLKNIPTNMPFLFAGDFNAEIGKKERGTRDPSLPKLSMGSTVEEDGKMIGWACGPILLHSETNDNGKKLISLVKAAHLKISSTFGGPMTPEGSSKEYHTFNDGQTKSQRSLVMLPCFRHMYVSKNFNNWEKGYHHALHGQIMDVEKGDNIDWLPGHDPKPGERKLPIISTWSIQGATPVKIDTILKEQCLPPIVCVQELFLTNEEDIKTDNYNWYTSKKPWAKNVGVLVSKGLEVQLLDFVTISSNLCYVDLVIQEKRLRVISLYLPAEDDAQHPETISLVNKIVEDLPKDMLSVLGGNYASIKPSVRELRRQLRIQMRSKKKPSESSADKKSESAKEGEKSESAKESEKSELANEGKKSESEKEDKKMDDDSELAKEAMDVDEELIKDSKDAEEELNEKDEKNDIPLDVDKNTNNSVFLEHLQENVTKHCLLVWRSWILGSGGSGMISQITEKGNKSVHILAPLANICKTMASLYLKWIPFFENSIVTMHLLEFPHLQYTRDESGNETRYVKVCPGITGITGNRFFRAPMEPHHRNACSIYICSEDEDHAELLEPPLPSVPLSPEDVEKFKDTVVPLEDLKRLLNDFVIFVYPSKRGIRASTAEILTVSFHYNNLGALVLEDPDTKEDKGPLRIRWNGIILDEVGGKKTPAMINSVRRKLCTSFLNKLAQFCYTVKAKRAYFNRGLAPVLMDDAKVKEQMKFAKKEDLPTMEEITKHIDSFFESDTDAELIFGPDFSTEELTAIVKYSKELSKELSHRYYRGSLEKKETDHLALSIRRTPHQLKEKLTKEPDNVKYYLLPPCPDGDRTDLAKYMELYEKENMKEEYNLNPDILNQSEKGPLNKDSSNSKQNGQTKAKSGHGATDLLTKAIEGLKASLLNNPQHIGQKKALKAANDLVLALQEGKFNETDQEFESNLDNLIKSTEETLNKPAPKRSFYTPKLKTLMREKKKLYEKYRKTGDNTIYNKFLEIRKEADVEFKLCVAKRDAEEEKVTGKKPTGGQQTTKGGAASRSQPRGGQARGAGRVTAPRGTATRGAGRATATRGAGRATATRGAGRATATRGAGRATATRGAGRATATRGAGRATATRGAGRATATRGTGRGTATSGGRREQQSRSTSYQDNQFRKRATNYYDDIEDKRPRMEYDNFPKVWRPQYGELGPLVMVWPITQDSRLEDRPLRLIKANFPADLVWNHQKTKVAILVTLPMNYGGEKEFCLSVEASQARAAQIALSFLERASTIIKPKPMYLCDGSVPHFVRYKIPDQGNPRSYIILTKYETGTLTPQQAHEILSTFKNSYNEDVFFDKDGYSENEKRMIMDLAPTADLKARYFGDQPGVHNSYICVSKKKSKQQIYDEVLKLGDRHPKYMFVKNYPESSMSVWETGPTKPLFDEPQRQADLFDQPQRSDYSQSNFSSSYSPRSSFSQRSPGQSQRYSVASNRSFADNGRSQNSGFKSRQNHNPWLTWSGAQ